MNDDPYDIKNTLSQHTYMVNGRDDPGAIPLREQMRAFSMKFRNADDDYIRDFGLRPKPIKAFLANESTLRGSLEAGSRENIKSMCNSAPAEGIGKRLSENDRANDTALDDFYGEFLAELDEHERSIVEAELAELSSSMTYARIDFESLAEMLPAGVMEINLHRSCSDKQNPSSQIGDERHGIKRN